MLRRVRFRAIRSGFRTENFRKTFNFRSRKISRPESREIAPKSALPDDAKPCHEASRSPNTVPSVGMLRRVRFRAIRKGFRTEIFEILSRPQNFASGIARDRAEIRVARRR